jgi:hypothetical protein
MRKLDSIFPSLKFLPALVITLVLGITLQLSGAWITMLLAGVLGSLFVRRHRSAFAVGFFGILFAWAILFTYVAVTAHALEIADFFIGLLGLSGMGMLVIVISCLIGGLLGGFGGLLGRSIVELVDELSPGGPEKTSEDSD